MRREGFRRDVSVMSCFALPHVLIMSELFPPALPVSVEGHHPEHLLATLLCEADR